MRRLLGESLDAGALGFSSSWAPTHLDGDGVPVPSRFADESELLELCDEVSRHPCSALEFIPGLGDFTEAEGELMGRMSAAADRPLNWNVLVVIAGIAERVRTSSAASDRAAELGGRCSASPSRCRCRPRLSFASGFLLDTIPGWQGPMTEPHADKLARLRSPEARAALLARPATPSSGLANFGQYVLTECTSPETKQYEGRTVADVAAELGRRPVRRAVRHRRGQRPAHRLLVPALRRHRRRLAGPCRRLARPARHHRCVRRRRPPRLPGHVQLPEVLLRRAVVDLGLLCWEEAISLMTDAPARLYGLADRGRLVEGAHADVVVLDPDAGRARAGREPHRSARPAAGGSTAEPPASTTCSSTASRSSPTATIGEARPGTVLRVRTRTRSRSRPLDRAP